MKCKKLDWTLGDGIASPGNLIVLLLVLVSFPAVLHWTDALAVATIAPTSPLHTGAFVKFCAIIGVYLWFCFAIAFVGIRSCGRISWREVVGVRWANWPAIFKNAGAVLATFLAMAFIGNLSAHFLGPLQQDSAAFRALTPQNASEALAFASVALTAGFVEEFIFRGYLQRQFTGLFGSTALATIAQIAIFTIGHAYQGWIRLMPVVAIACVLTAVALWRKSLVPGMIAHGLGDGLVALMYFAKHL